jgi:hypothetical protein
MSLSCYFMGDARLPTSCLICSKSVQPGKEVVTHFVLEEYVIEGTDDDEHGVVWAGSSLHDKKPAKRVTYEPCHARCMDEALVTLRKRERDNKALFYKQQIIKILYAYDRTSPFHQFMHTGLSLKHGNDIPLTKGFFPYGSYDAASGSFALVYNVHVFPKVAVDAFLVDKKHKDYASLSLFTQCVRLLPFRLTVVREGKDAFYTALNGDTMEAMLVKHFDVSTPSGSSVFVVPIFEIDVREQDTNAKTSPADMIFDVTLVVVNTSTSSAVDALASSMTASTQLYWKDLLDTNHVVGKARVDNEKVLNQICDTIVREQGTHSFMDLARACKWYMKLEPLANRRTETSNSSSSAAECASTSAYVLPIEHKSRFSVHVDVNPATQLASVLFNTAGAASVSPLFVDADMVQRMSSKNAAVRVKQSRLFSSKTSGTPLLAVALLRRPDACKTYMFTENVRDSEHSLTQIVKLVKTADGKPLTFCCL